VTTRKVVFRRLVLGVAVALTACACGVRETPEQRVTRLRQQYEVKPTGFQPHAGPDGRPGLVIDMLVLDQGREGLKELTLVARLMSADGKERVAKPFTIDVSRLIPGVTSQVSAVVPDVELKSGETVTVELENEPPPAARSSYPEYRAVSSPG
jgi:FtsP/CotA-like multicopper oxidase with cupredoxin domain